MRPDGRARALASETHGLCGFAHGNRRAALLGYLQLNQGCLDRAGRAWKQCRGFVGGDRKWRLHHRLEGENLEENPNFSTGYSL